MTTAHLIHGFLGAGKTSLARQLEASFPAIRFTHDEWMVRLYGTSPPTAMFPVYFDRASRQIDSLWPRCLELGLDVVLDLNFWSRSHRERARRRAGEAGAECVLYRLQTPDDVARERITRRNAEPEQMLITSETFDVLKRRFEPLEPDEPALEVSSLPP